MSEIKLDANTNAEVNKNIGIEAIIEKQREYFRSGATLPVASRVAMLKKLYAVIKKREDDICAALTSDLGKSDFEGFM